jgi:hypothetical protein
LTRSELTVFVDTNEQAIKLLNALGHETLPAILLKSLRLGWHYDEDPAIQAPVMAEFSLDSLQKLYLHVDVSQTPGDAVRLGAAYTKLDACWGCWQVGRREVPVILKACGASVERIGLYSDHFDGTPALPFFLNVNNLRFRR